MPCRGGHEVTIRRLLRSRCSRPVPHFYETLVRLRPVSFRQTPERLPAVDQALDDMHNICISSPWTSSSTRTKRRRIFTSTRSASRTLSKRFVIPTRSRSRTRIQTTSQVLSLWAWTRLVESWLLSTLHAGIKPALISARKASKGESEQDSA